MGKPESGSQMQVFVNFRSEDTLHAASRLRSDLQSCLSNARVFGDELIDPGSDWKKLLRVEVERSRALLVLIGKRWLRSYDDETGDRSLNNADDWVRREIEWAVDAGVEILPLLVDGTPPLTETQIKSLRSTKLRAGVDRQAGKLRGRRDWEPDVQLIVAWLVKRGFRKAKRSSSRKGKTVSPSRTADVRSRKLATEIEAYLRHAGALYADVELAGFETRLRVPIRLEDLYVPLHARCDLRGTHKGAYGSAEEAELGVGEECHEIALTDVFRTEGPWARRRGLVILGDPGSGKTTQLKRLLLWMVKEGPTSLGLPEGMVPVFLPLRDHSDIGQELDAFMEQVLSGPPLGLSRGFGRRLLRRGNLLVLLDGLDEVGSLADRVAVTRWINDAAAIHEDCRFVVTCRYAGYREEVELSDHFLELHLRPLEPAQAEDFVRRWFHLVETSLAVNESQGAHIGDERATELIGKLREPVFKSRRMRELTRNPLLLTAICLVQRDRGKLPHRRAELYDECVNVLLERWRDAKKLDVHFPAADARRVLQPVAHWLHGEAGRTRATAEKLAPVLDAGLASVKQKDVSAEAFLETIRDESGLLTGWSDRAYGFMHLGFQEYLAAREIRSRAFLGEDDLRKLANCFGESWWREPTLLLLALEEPSLFGPLMELVLARPEVLKHTDLLDECIEESIQVTPAPFVGLLRRKPGRDEGLWARQLVALRSLGRFAPEAIEELEATLGKHPSPDISGWIKARRQEARRDRIVATQGGYELVLLPAGRFTMGSPDDEVGRYDGEGPVHEVRVPSFYLGRCPVTNQEYGLFLNSNPDAQEPEYWSDKRFNLPDQPVVGVSWEDAQRYCEWAGLRLPSEAEWEYACRAGTSTRYWSGDAGEDLARVGWYEENSGGRLHPVGEKPASPFGLHDMHGNVWEWCEDRWHENYKDAPDDGRAWTDGGSPYRVHRGGSWLHSARYCRSAYRLRHVPSGRWNLLGFRPAAPCP